MMSEKKEAFRGFADMHTHSKHSHDSVCEMRDMYKAMKEKNVFAFAVTNHFDTQYASEIDIFTPIEEAAKEARSLSRDGELPEVLCGIELGEGFWNKPVRERAMSLCDYDVVICSVHSVKFRDLTMPYVQINFGAMPYNDVLTFLDTYFDDMLEMMSCPDFDILAHLTCPLRYITGKYGIKVPLDTYSDKIDEILKLTVKNGIALEVNTSNLGSAYDELMPNEGLIRRYRELGGTRITLGSDAHIAENAAKDFEAAAKTLVSMGFDEALCFKKRKGIPYPLC